MAEVTVHTHILGLGESFAAGKQAVRKEMKCLIRERMANGIQAGLS